MNVDSHVDLNLALLQVQILFWVVRGFGILNLVLVIEMIKNQIIGFGGEAVSHLAESAPHGL